MSKYFNRNGILFPYGNLSIPIKQWSDTQFMHLLDEHTYIMIQTLQKILVGWAGLRLGPCRVAKLAFDHLESDLNSRPPVVMSIERRFVQCEVSMKASPRRGSLTNGVAHGADGILLRRELWTDYGS